MYYCIVSKFNCFLLFPHRLVVKDEDDTLFCHQKTYSHESKNLSDVKDNEGIAFYIILLISFCNDFV